MMNEWSRHGEVKSMYKSTSSDVSTSSLGPRRASKMQAQDSCKLVMQRRLVLSVPRTDVEFVVGILNMSDSAKALLPPARTRTRKLRPGSIGGTGPLRLWWLQLVATVSDCMYYLSSSQSGEGRGSERAREFGYRILVQLLNKYCNEGIDKIK